MIVILKFDSILFLLFTFLLSKNYINYWNQINRSKTKQKLQKIKRIKKWWISLLACQPTLWRSRLPISVCIVLAGRPACSIPRSFRVGPKRVALTRLPPLIFCLHSYKSTCSLVWMDVVDCGFWISVMIRFRGFCFFFFYYVDT